MSSKIFAPRTINLQACRVQNNANSCSVVCDKQEEELIVIPADVLNKILQDKNIGEITLKIGDFLSAHATDITGARQLQKLFKEFGFLGKAYQKTIKGKSFIIFKGRAGLRKIFTGTKYQISNSKILSFGIGKAGVARSIKVGPVLSLVFVNAWNIAEYFINDKGTLADLGVNIISDSVKTVLAGVAGGIVAGVAVSLGAPIIVPIALGLVVGIVVGEILDRADNKWKITESIKIWANEVSRDIKPKLNNAGNFVHGTMRTAGNQTGNMWNNLTNKIDSEFKEWSLWFDNFSKDFR